MSQMDDILITFFQECDEQLSTLETGLIAMEEGDTSLETVNAVFRAVHSIKGGAGAFKLVTLVTFSHVFETTLDCIRSGQLASTKEVMGILLRASGELYQLVIAARDNTSTDETQTNALLAEMKALVNKPAAEETSEADDAEPDFEFTPIGVMEIATSQAAGFVISFRPHLALFEKANDPIALLRELSALGHTEIECITDGLPSLSEFDAHGSYLSWTIRLSTQRSIKDVQEIFDFVDGDCDLRIEPVLADMPAVAALPAIELAAAAVVERVEEKVAAPESQVQQTKTSSAQPTIRVELDRVDRLINNVGELVINQAVLSQHITVSGLSKDREVKRSLMELAQLTREIQESVMAIRAQPVKPLFQRMSMVVREVAHATGKDVKLITEGDATEVDKTIIEKLADPLTHMVRNAVDHGVETQEARVAAGKPAAGTVKLSAAHRSGRVVIEIKDDGAGINRDRVLASAVKKGLVAADAQLSDTEIDNLLFLPGFSTAATVSNISGRGVGMDVVKRSIQSLGGRIGISSTPHHGSVFTLSLPLTLAVLDGIAVSIGAQTFVIPLSAIVETLKPDAASYKELGSHEYVIPVRGQFVPLIDVGFELSVRQRNQKPHEGVAILVETESNSQCALLVDKIQDQRQVVIKSLEANYGAIPGIAAATILGDGRVAMILDVDSLVSGRRNRHIPPQPQYAKVS